MKKLLICTVLAFLLAGLYPVVAQDEPEPLFILQHDGTVKGAVWSSDESRILSWSNASQDCEENCMSAVHVWDVQNGEELFTLQHDAAVAGAAWNRDENRILSWTAPPNFCTVDCVSTVYVWDAESGEQLLSIQYDDIVRDAVWNNDGSRILSRISSSVLCEEDCVYAVDIWDFENNEEVLRLYHNDIVQSAEWNSDESQILTSSFDGFLHVWDVANGEELRTFGIIMAGRDMTAWCAHWSHDESRVAGCIYGWLDVYSVESGRRIFNQRCTVPGHVAWNNDDTRIRCYSDQYKRVTVWDVESGEELQTFRGTGGAWNHDETRLLTWTNAAWDCTEDCEYIVHIWDAESGEELLTLNHDDTINSAMWSNDGTRILSSSDDGTVRVWGN